MISDGQSGHGGGGLVGLDDPNWEENKEGIVSPLFVQWCYVPTK